MGFFSDHKQLLAVIPAIIIWGCFGGLCFTAVCFYIENVYASILYSSCYFRIILLVYEQWIFGTLIILSLILGMIAADLFHSSKKTNLDPVLTGLLSGIITAVVGYVLVYLYPEEGFRWFWPNTPLDVLFVHVGGSMPVMYFIVLVLPQVLGAWYQGSRRMSGSDKSDTTPTRVFTVMRSRHWILLVVLLGLLLVIPMVFSVLPVDDTRIPCVNGDRCVPGDCGRTPSPDNVSVTRTSPDSIRIGVKTYSSCGTSNTFKIFLNGKDISNQGLITKSGLSVTITPKDGLGTQDGSSVILQGKDVVVNETFPTHIRVNGTPPDMNTPLVFSDQYL